MTTKNRRENKGGAKRCRDISGGCHAWRKGHKVLAIVGAVVAGLVVVYGGQQDATFGANGIADALSIGAWGFAADLSGRGLLKRFKR